MDDLKGGFLIELPGYTAEQIREAINAVCPECGAGLGTHFPKCSLETRKPRRIIMTGRTNLENCNNEESNSSKHREEVLPSDS